MFHRFAHHRFDLAEISSLLSSIGGITFKFFCFFYMLQVFPNKSLIFVTYVIIIINQNN